MNSQHILKGQLRHLLIHFGVEFENPYLDSYSPHDEVIDKFIALSVTESMTNPYPSRKTNMLSLRHPWTHTPIIECA